MIINIIANYFEVPEKILCSPEDKREFNEARDLLIYFLRKRTSSTIMDISRITGRHYTNIHRALRRVRNRIDVYPEIRDHIKEIDRLIKRIE